jgi:hypothetical protein
VLDELLEAAGHPLAGITFRPTAEQILASARNLAMMLPPVEQNCARPLAKRLFAQINLSLGAEKDVVISPMPAETENPLETAPWLVETN